MKWEIKCMLVKLTRILSSRWKSLEGSLTMHSQLRLLVKLLHVISTLTILIASLRMAKITMTPSNPPKKQYRTYWYLMVLVKKSYIDLIIFYS